MRNRRPYKYKMKPRVSVILPVFNGARFLGQSIDSILAQDFSDFELIIINDGSNDDSGAIIKGYQYDRIRYLVQDNQGLPATLNRGLEMAKGDILIRQDQDDISLPDRIVRQVQVLDEDPTLGVVGCWAEIIDENSVPDGRTHRHPTELAALRTEVLFNTPFVHSSVAIRKSTLQALGGYSTDPERQPPEDFELWSRLLRISNATNIPGVLVRYREVSSSMSRVMKREFVERMVHVSAENLAYWVGCTGRAVNPEVAKFAAQIMVESDLRHDCSVSCADVLKLFDDACEGIISKSVGHSETERSRSNLRFQLRRAWSVGAPRSRTGMQIERARWKIARILRG
jgi:glycosyltransferase involved in cell wall biosynthesis